MAKDRSLVRASDIGSWAFCQRAWWLANVRGAVHQQSEVLAHGNQVHVAHGRQVRRFQRLRVIGLWLIAIALILAGLALAAWVLWG